MRRVAALLALLAGLVLVGFTFTEHLFSRSSDAETIADRYAGLMSERGLHDLRRGFDAVQAAGAQLTADAEPALQRRLHLDDARFDAYVRTNLSGVARFDKEAPGVVALVGPVIAQMEAARTDYARASDIPVSWLPLSSAPWLFLGIGALLIAVGGLALVRPGTGSTAALFVVAAGVFVAPLVVGIPGKVDAAERVTAIGRVGLAPATAQKAVAATALFDGMVRDVRDRLRPALTDEPGGRDFDVRFPVLARFADDWANGISRRSHDLSDSQVRYAPTFADADRIPLRPIPWLFVVPGASVALLAGGSLVAGARLRRPVPSPHPAAA
jgi:hypothetical protein